MLKRVLQTLFIRDLFIQTNIINIQKCWFLFFLASIGSTDNTENKCASDFNKRDLKNPTYIFC